MNNRPVTKNTSYRFWEIFFPALLGIILIVICYLNYQPNTWLVGWDTLLPELDFTGQFKNLFFGAWRQDQGLGAVAAHSHMSELPRVAILWLASWVLPANLLRYSFIFLCFVLGPLGIYFFLRRVLSDRLQLGKKSMISVVLIPSFLAAVFYTFNLATLQHFYLVFEMFAVQYAALGWLFLSLYLCLTRRRWRDFFSYFLSSFLASSMAYASQLYIAYALGLGLFLLFFWLLGKDKKATGKIILGVIGLTVAANAYWLLPTGYFLLTKAAAVPAASQINQTFSTESFLQNQAFGDLADTLILKNFLFNWQQFDFTGNSFEQIMAGWQNHFQQNWWWQVWPYIMSILGIVGLIGAILVPLGLILRKKTRILTKRFLQKNRVLISLAPVALLAVVMIMNSNPPWTLIFDWLREQLPLFREGLRTPYTKFSLLLLFTLVTGLGFFFSILAEKFSWWRKNWGGQLLLVTVFLTSAIGFCWPFFQGQLIDPLIKKNIPDEYFTFWYFARENLSEKARIALLPAETYSAWEYHDWGYEGAGFIWFGLRQPFLTRDFDRWNVNNEDFYRQFSTAWHQLDTVAVAEILQKYQVSYLLVDKSLFQPKQTEQNEAAIRQIRQLLLELGYERIFDQGNLELYAVSEGVGTETEDLVMDEAMAAKELAVDEAMAAKELDLEKDSTATKEAATKEMMTEELTSEKDLTATETAMIKAAKVSNETARRETRAISESFISAPESFNYLVNQEDYTRLEPILRAGYKNWADFGEGQNPPSQTIYFPLTQFSRDSLPEESFYFEQNWLKIPFVLPAGHHKITLPASTWTVKADKSLWYLAAVEITYTDNGQINFNFVPDLTVQNTRGETLTTREKMTDFNWSVYAGPADEKRPAVLYLDFGDQQLKLTRSEPTQQFFWLPVGQDLELKVFSEEDVFTDETGKKAVNLSAVKTLSRKIENWADLTAKVTIGLEENSEAQNLILILPAFEKKYDLSEIAEQPVLTCESGLTSQDINRVFESDELIYWTKNNESLCGQLVLPTAGFNLAKIVELKTSNYFGRPLKISFFNQRTGLVEVEKLMPENEVVSVSRLVLLPNRDSGYILNWNNRSFGRVASKNALETEVKSWDFNLLSLLEVEISPVGIEKENLAVDNSGWEYEIERSWPTYYRLKVKNQSGMEKMLVLGQSYEDGWQAKIISTDSDDEMIGKGQKIAHGRYNGWANAWLVPTAEGEMTIEIYYWPQILEWLGLGIWGITILGLIVTGFFWERKR